MNALKLNNGLEIDFVVRDGKFAGLGGVRSGDVALRSGRRPMFVEIRNPSGIELIDWQVTDSKVSPEGATLTLKGKRREGGIMEYMVHTVRNRVNTADWTDEPTPADDTVLKLDIRPVTRNVDGSTFKGFSYQYTYSSKSVPIYRINDRSTWEINGQAVGNTFLMRNCFVPAVTEIKAVDQQYSTEWFLPDCANPNVFQFLPLQTELQGFSYTSHEKGVLVTWVPTVSHVRSLFEKQRGKNEIVHRHEHCSDLANEFSSPVVEVLFSAGKRDRVQTFNLYESVKELVHETLHQDIGMRRERVTTYGQIEEWTPADIKRYTEAGLPKLLDAGCTTIYVANHFQNNMNTWGVGNMCCTVDYKVADTVGADNLKRFCDVAKAGGARVEMWGNTSISALTWIFGWDRRGAAGRINHLPLEGSIMDALKGVTNAFVRNASNAIEADHYTPVFCVLNLREPAVREYWMRQWSKAATEIGLGGIFLDSSFNLSSDKFHWVQNVNLTQAGGATVDQIQLLGHHRPAEESPAGIYSQYRAHLDLFVEMQKAGYVYCNEDLGVFGVHRHGPGIEKRLDSIPMWTDCYTGYDHGAIVKQGSDPEKVYFEGLANRMMWSLHWDVSKDSLSWNYYGIRDDNDVPTSWQIGLLKAYMQVEPYLQKRTILADGKGILWSGGGKLVLWAMDNFKHPLGEKTSVQEVLTGQTSSVSTLDAKTHQIYLIG